MPDLEAREHAPEAGNDKDEGATAETDAGQGAPVWTLRFARARDGDLDPTVDAATDPVTPEAAASAQEAAVVLPLRADLPSDSEVCDEAETDSAAPAVSAEPDDAPPKDAAPETEAAAPEADEVARGPAPAEPREEPATSERAAVDSTAASTASPSHDPCSEDPVSRDALVQAPHAQDDWERLNGMSDTDLERSVAMGLFGPAADRRVRMALAIRSLRRQERTQSELASLRAAAEEQRDATDRAAERTARAVSASLVAALMAFLSVGAALVMLMTQYGLL